MALYSFNELLKPARKQGIGIAAINLANYETAAALFEAAVSKNESKDDIFNSSLKSALQNPTRKFSSRL